MRPFRKVCYCGKGYMSRHDHQCGNCRDPKALELYLKTNPQRVIVAGGRDYVNRDGMHNVLTALVKQGIIREPCELVCGMARGADMTAYNLFTEYGIRIHEFPADWDNLGKRAGFVRNGDMAYFADILVAFWDGQSAGTKHMIDTMERLEKPVYICRY